MRQFSISLFLAVLVAATVVHLSSCQQHASNSTDGMANDSLLLDTIDVALLVDTLDITANGIAGMTFSTPLETDTICLYGIQTVAVVDESHSISVDLDLAGKDERSVARLIIALQQHIKGIASGIVYSDAWSLLVTLPKEDDAATDLQCGAVMLLLVDDHLQITLYSGCDQSELDFLTECINDPSLWVNEDERPDEIEATDETDDPAAAV